MIKIINGQFADIKQEKETIDNLFEAATLMFEDYEVDVTLLLCSYNDRNDKLEYTGDIVHRVITEYELNNEKFEFIHEKSNLELAVLDSISSYLKRISCDHKLINKLDENGLPFPDGRSFCDKCDIELPDGAEPILNRKVISMSFGEDVSSTFDWGDISIQGGRKGIVFNRKDKTSYRTAFVEAFPKINGLGTFIRGQGESVTEAEIACWDKYQKILNCDQHDWTRKVNGDRERKDGYAKCTKCNMQAKALDPLTKCFVCNEPTTNDFEDKYVCWSHYFDLDIEDVMKYELSEIQEFSSETIEQSIFDFKLRYQLEKLWFDRLGKEKFQIYYDRITHVYIHFSHMFLSHVMGKTFSSEFNDYPEMSDPRLIDAIDYLKGNMGKMEGFVLAKEKSLKLSYLLNK